MAGPSVNKSNEAADANAAAKKTKLRKDLLFAPICEGALLLVVSLAGWITHQPLVFASLGPTAYELIETPKRPSARPYNILVGHLIGVLAGFAALYLTGAWHVVPAVSANGVPLLRVWSAVAAAVITVMLTLLLRATQPAALSTTLLVSLGLMQQWRDGAVIMGAVLLMTLAGEPLRLWRARTTPDVN